MLLDSAYGELPRVERPTVPYVRESETSRAAAASVDGVVKHRAEVVLAAVRAAADGLTCDEAELVLGWSHQSVSPRINGLARQELIVDSGRRRKTRSGRD